jgi:hypothetical protein
MIMTSLTVLFLTACNTTSSSDNGIELTAVCNTENNTSNYQLLQSGDQISAKEVLYYSNTAPEVEIFHTTGGEKKACIKSGTAVIYR